MNCMIATAPRFPQREALAVAYDFVDVLKDFCERISLAGSLRRRKPFVKDVEIVFVSKSTPDPQPPDDMFKPRPPLSLAEIAIGNLLDAGLLRKRPNINGVESWGAKNKLGIHAPTGMPVDLFTAPPENFFNYLVCRTGGEESNIRVASAAIARGWKWNPYGSGFSRPKGLTLEHHVVTSEREVFEFVGLPYLEPWKR